MNGVAILTFTVSQHGFVEKETGPFLRGQTIFGRTADQVKSAARRFDESGRPESSDGFSLEDD